MPAKLRRELGHRLATGDGRQRGDSGGAGRLLPVHHRPPGLAGPPEERHAAHRRQGRRRTEGLASTTRPCRPSTRSSASSSRTPPALHLNQGPITVFEGSVYAGDTRVLDVQPNEERLVSYAIDLGTEVDPQVGPGTQKITQREGRQGDRHHDHEGHRGEEVPDRSTAAQTDRTLLDRASRTAPTSSSSWSIPTSRSRTRRRCTASRRR